MTKLIIKMNVAYLPLGKLIELNEQLKLQIEMKEIKIKKYLTYRLRQYLLSFGHDKLEDKYVLSHIKFLRTCHEFMECKVLLIEGKANKKFVSFNCEIHIDRGQELVRFPYKKNMRHLSYDFGKQKIFHSPKHSVSRDIFDKFETFSKWLKKIGVQKLLDHIYNIHDKINDNPILETRDACLCFLLCCKFGGVPLSRDVAQIIAKKVWEDRYQSFIRIL